MNTNKSSWLIGLVFLLVAVSMRMYRIDWSVSGDHTSMLGGVRSLREKPFFSLDGLEGGELQSRYMPLSYFLQGVAFDAFGWDERGSRTGSAIVGALTIAMLVVIVSRLYGVGNAIILGTMLLMCSWLLGQSQNNRHYSYAVFFGSLALVMTADAWKKDSWGRGAIAGILTAVAVAILPILLILLFAILVFMVIEVLFKRSPAPRKTLLAYWALCIPLTICGLAPYIWFMLNYTGPSFNWPSSSWRSIAGLVFNLGFSVTVLALIGWCLAVWKGNITDRLCAVVATAAVVSCLVVPMFHSFKQEYVLPLSLAFFMLASRVLTIVYEAVKQARGKGIAVAITAAVLLVPLPSLASYYQDGDRKDYRSAAKFIKENARRGDIIAADTRGALAYYLDVPVEAGHRIVSRPDQAMEALGKLTATGKRVWYVCRYARDVLRPDADRWLWTNAVRMRRIMKKRFDYHENIVDVYLFNADRTESGG